MSDYTLTIKADEKKGVLDDITDVITEHGANISYVHLFVEKNNVGSINLELEHVEDIDELVSDLKSIPEIKTVELHGSQLDIYGKRIIIIGGGAQVSQVAMGAITEADRHNIRGERISIDTIPLVGEKNLAEALEAMGVKIDVVLNIEVSDDEIVTRMSGRRTCLKCGGTYHIEFNPPKSEGICDNCGAELTIRKDDAPEVVMSRLEVYHNETEPLKAFYEKKGVVKTVVGQKELKDTTALTLKAFGIED